MLGVVIDGSICVEGATISDGVIWSVASNPLAFVLLIHADVPTQEALLVTMKLEAPIDDEEEVRYSDRAVVSKGPGERVVDRKAAPHWGTGLCNAELTCWQRQARSCWRGDVQTREAQLDGHSHHGFALREAVPLLCSGASGVEVRGGSDCDWHALQLRHDHLRKHLAQ